MTQQQQDHPITQFVHQGAQQCLNMFSSFHEQCEKAMQDNKVKEQIPMIGQMADFYGGLMKNHHQLCQQGLSLSKQMWNQGLNNPQGLQQMWNMENPMKFWGMAAGKETKK